MKKLVSIIALLAMVLLASSGFNDRVNVTKVGDISPILIVSNHYTTFDLSQNNGQYVLLTFWASSDAKSRVDCNTYSAWVANHHFDNLKHIAINFDSQQVLFDQIVRLDGLDAKAQFNVKGLQAVQIRNDFGLINGYGSVLISPDGRVMAYNPKTTDLLTLSNEQLS